MIGGGQVMRATRPSAATGGMAVDGLKSRFKTVFSLGMEGPSFHPAVLSVCSR